MRVLYVPCINLDGAVQKMQSATANITFPFKNKTSLYPSPKTDCIQLTLSSWLKIRRRCGSRCRSIVGEMLYVFNLTIKNHSHVFPGTLHIKVNKSASKAHSSLNSFFLESSWNTLWDAAEINFFLAQKLRLRWTFIT